MATSALAQLDPVKLSATLVSPSSIRSSYEYQGRVVATANGRVAVGSLNADVGESSAGVVRVYEAATGALLHTLQSPVPVDGARFGWAVAMSDDYLAVGAPWDHTTGSFAGRVFVFDLAGPTPTVPRWILENPNPDGARYFGEGVAISGSTVAVGSPQEDAPTSGAGSVYFFDLDQPNPAEPKLRVDNPHPEDAPLFSFTGFGTVVALDGNRLAVAMPSDDIGDKSGVGRAYVFDRASPTPNTPVCELTSPQNGNFTYFGTSIAIAGSTVVAGAPDHGGEINAQGRAYVFEIEGANPGIPSLTLTNTDGKAFRYLGESVTIHGRKVFVSVPRYDSTLFNDPGRLLGFDLDSANPGTPFFSGSVMLREDDGLVDGSSICFDGHWLVAGDPLDDTAAKGAGAVFVFDLTSADPTALVAKLAQASPSTEDNFGIATAASGTRVAVGSLNPIGSDFAAIYVYDFAGPVPQVIEIPNPNPASDDGFGSSVALEGSRLIVGAPQSRVSSSAQGRVYEYDLASVTPAIPVRTLLSSNPDQDECFGKSIALAGHRLAVGTGKPDRTFQAPPERVYVFELVGGTPEIPIAVLTNPSATELDNFGGAVALSGNLVIVSASADDQGARDAGVVHGYDLTSETFTIPVWTLTNPEPESDDQFGLSVSCSGQILVVGTPFDSAIDDETGSAYVYDLHGAAMPTLRHTLNNPALRVGDRFGSSLSLSGALLAVGVLGNGFANDEPGRVYLYDLNGTNPTIPVDEQTNPSPNRGDEFGRAVALSGGEAGILVVGAPFDDTSAVDRGAAYIYASDPLQPPVAGSMTIAPGLLVAGATGVASATFSGWLDLDTPLSYQLLIDDVAVADVSTQATIPFTVPTAAGMHHFTGRVVDALGNVATISLDRSVVTAPFVTTQTATNLTFRSAVLHGIASANGLATTTRFEYSTSPTLADATTTPNVSLGANANDVPLTAALTNLTEGTTYYFRAIAESTSGVVKGDILSFRTPAVQPPRVVVIPGGNAGGANLPPGTVVVVIRGGDGQLNSGTVQSPDGARSEAIFDNTGNVLLRTGQEVPLPGAPATARERGAALTGVVKKLGIPCGDAVLATLAAKRGVVSGKDDQVLFAGLAAGQPQLVAREGGAIDNVPGVVIKSFLAIDGNGTTTFFTAKLKGDEVNRTNDLGLLAVQPGAAPRLVARKGDMVDDLQVRTLTTLTGFAGSLAEGRWRAGEDEFGIRVTFNDGTHALFLVPADATSPDDWFGVLKTDDAAGSALPDAQLLAFPQPAFGPAALLTHATLRAGPGGVTKATGDGIFRADGIALRGSIDAELVLQRNRSLLGATLVRTRTTLAGVGLASAFVADVKLDSERKPQQTIYDAGADGQFRAVARIGGTAPGGGKWSRFTSVVKADGATRGLVFTATLAVSAAEGVNAGNRMVLYGVDSSGELRQLLRTGDEIALDEDGLVKAKVKSFTALQGAAGSLGAARAHDAEGGVTVVVTFADRSRAVVKIDVP